MILMQFHSVADRRTQSFPTGVLDRELCTVSVDQQYLRLTFLYTVLLMIMRMLVLMLMLMNVVFNTIHFLVPAMSN